MYGRGRAIATSPPYAQAAHFGLFALSLTRLRKIEKEKEKECERVDFKTLFALFLFLTISALVFLGTEYRNEKHSKYTFPLL